MLNTLLTFITFAAVVAAGDDDDKKIFIKSKKPEKHGKSFVVIGGFGNMKDLNRTNYVFDAINDMKKNQLTASALDTINKTPWYKILTMQYDELIKTNSLVPHIENVLSKLKENDP